VKRRQPRFASQHSGCNISFRSAPASGVAAPLSARTGGGRHFKTGWPSMIDESAPEVVQQFNHCPRCAAATQAHGRNPFRCSTCGLLLFFNAACAVAAFILNERGQILYTRRAKAPSQGRLGMPGGFVDAGESAEEALRREVREEIGIDLTSVEYLASFPNRYAYGGVTYLTLDLFFLAGTDQAARARALDAVASLEWRAPAEVDPADLAFDSMRRALLAFQQRC
jgi:mutator protein MutT